MSASEERAATRPPIVMPKPGIFGYLASGLLWIFGVAWIMPMLVLLSTLHTLFPIRIIQHIDRVYLRGQIVLLLGTWRKKIHPEIDLKGAYIFMQNHTNHFDHVMMYNATPHIKQGLEAQRTFKYPFYGWFMKSRGTIPVDKGRSGQSERVMEHIKSEIDKGHSILAFPEGTRTKTGHVEKLRRGTFFIARDLGVPIVPVTVTGTYEVMQRGAWSCDPLNPSQCITARPIPTQGVSDEELPELIQKVHDAMSAPLDAYWVARGFMPAEHDAPIEAPEANAGVSS